MTTSPVLPPQGLVLAGFIPEDEARMRRALSLPDEAFERREDSFLFRAYREYWRLHRGVLPIQFIADRLKSEPPETAHAVAARFQVLRDTVVDDSVYEWALVSVFEDWRDGQARAALHSAVQILVGTGAVEGEGAEAHALRGYQAMRDKLSRSWSKIDRQAQGTTPEIEMVDSLEMIAATVGSAGRADDRFHFKTRIDVIDESQPWGGPASGQFWFLAAYAGQGKTTFCTSVFAYQAMMQGLNVVYLTGETLLEEVQLKLVARHCREPQFGLPGGVDTLAIRRPDALPQDHVEGFYAAAHDLTSRSGTDYGHFVVRQMPMRNNVDDVMNSLERTEAAWPVHVLIVDSIDMVRIPAEMARGAVSYREQLSATIEDFANLAVSYANGRGLIVITPYQIKRDAFERAVENKGRYELSALSETAMAERRASVVLSILRLPEVPGQLKAQFLKNRHGSEPEFSLDVDYRSAFIGASAGSLATSTDLHF